MPDIVLFIADPSEAARSLEKRLVDDGWRVQRANDFKQARNKLVDRQERPLVILADQDIADGDCLDLLEQSANWLGAAMEWLLVSGRGSVADSVRALKLGAFDFLEKPLDEERLAIAVQRAARSARAHRRLALESARRHSRYSVERFIGGSQLAADTRDMLLRLANAGCSTLILLGATGTGKGLAANIIHYNGPRANGPMVEINCAALPEELLESELFGHEAGAFTGARGLHEGLFEQADQGTLFLDEIAEMPLGLQAKLLKAVEEQSIRRVGGENPIKVDVQIIAATNRDLETEVEEHRFRGDLYHRLSVFQLRLPSLAERIEDIQELVEQFVAEFNQRTNQRISEIPAAVWEELVNYPWPGNVRELRNVIERCVLMSRGPVIEQRWLQLSRPDQPGMQVEQDRICFTLNGKIGLEEIERRIIEQALKHTDGNITQAGELLGISRQTMRYRIEKHQVELDQLSAGD